MRGYVVVAVGWLLLLAGLILVVGWWVLIPAGVVTMTVGAVVDLDPAPREAQRDQRRP